MPLDYGNFKFEERPSKSAEDRRIYVCEDGSIRLETRHFRQTFSPEEFVALVRGILIKAEKNFQG